MKKTLQGNFDPCNPAQVEDLLTNDGKQLLPNTINAQIRVERMVDASDAVVIYQVRAGKSIYVVRFALQKWQEDEFRREALVAQNIGPLVRIEIPEIGFFPAEDGYPSFTLHQWIAGEPLTTEMYISMTTESKQRLVNDLTEFLIAVHSIDIQETADWNGWLEWGIASCDFGKPIWFDRVFRERAPTLLMGQLQPELASAAISTIEEFEQLSVDQVDMAFVHGDIHGFNLAMRPGLYGFELNGIFDLENAGVLDIHEDFFRLYFIDQELVDHTIKAYNQKNPNRKPLDNERINLYWRAFLLYLMVENLEQENLSQFQLYENIFVETIKAKK